MFDFEDSFVQRLVTQDEQAFAQFYDMTADIFYRYLMWRYFLRESDAHDLLSDFYLKCWKGLWAYNPEYKFETYVRSILKNHTKDFFKKKKSIQLKDEHMSDTSLIEWSEKELLADLQKDFDLQTIQDVLWDVDEQTYEVIYMRYIDEMSYEEMSAFLDITQDAVRQRLSRSLKKVKERLGVY